jgi:hypothetical protein
MKKKYVLLFSLLVLAVQLGFGQARDTRLKMKGYINPQEIVSLDSTMRMDQALLVLNELSKQFAGKIIIDLEKHRSPIGVYVVNQHWRDALEMILTHNGLTFTEEPDFIRIVERGATSALTAGGAGAAPAPGEPPPTLDSRDVKISAVFFSTNLTKLQDYGISWNFFRSKAKEPGQDYYISSGIGAGDTLGNIPPRPRGSLDKALAVISSPPSFTFANIDALVKFFGSNQLGEVLTSPDITVRNGKAGRIQVGKDIFVVTRDIAGNAISQLLSTGTIVEVTPTVYSQSDTDFVYLNLLIEQSDAQPGPEINRTQVKTHALLFDGEETVIGGLVTTIDNETREGIPVLKDLPWWFFGLRYIFGSDSKIKSKNELIVLLKAEILKPIRERMVHRRTQQEILDEQRKHYQQEYEKK